MKKKKWLAVLAAVAVVVAGVVLISNGQNQVSDQTNPTVRAFRGPISVSVVSNGVVEAQDQKDLVAQASGQVTELYVKEGDQVSAGDPIARLTDESLAEQNSSLEVQREKLALELQQRQDELHELESNLEHLKVKAPAAGRVTGLNVREGQNVSPGQNLLGLKQEKILEAKLPFNRSQVQNIRVGQEAELFISDYLATVPGEVVAVDSQGRATETGGILCDVTVRLTNPGALYAGQSVSGKVAAGEGTLAAVESTTLTQPAAQAVFSQVSGKVNNLAVAEDMWVEAGDLLLEVDPQDLEQQIESKKLQIRQIELDLAGIELKSPTDVVLAPIDGTLTVLDLALGDEVKTGQVLGKVVDYGRLEVVVPVDEMDIGKLKVGQKAMITSTALPEQEFTGQVLEIAREGQAQGGVATFDVTLSLGKTDLLRAGMTVKAEIIIDSKDDALLLPVTAVQKQQDAWVVWLSATGTEPVWQEVKLGLVDENNAEILSGLSEGEEVVLPEWRGPSGAAGPPFEGGQRSPAGQDRGASFSFGGGSRN